MKNKFKGILVLMMLSVLLLGASCSSGNGGQVSDGNEMYPSGFENGLCDGAGDILWGMSYDDILKLEGAEENTSNQIVFGQKEFAGCVGDVICKFDDTGLNAIVYSFAGETPYDDYEKIVSELTGAYGEPLSMAGLSEAREQNSFRAMDMWKENVVSSEGKRVVILAEMKPPKGWITVNFIIQPET